MIFEGQDRDIFWYFIEPEELIEMLSPQQVLNFMETLGISAEEKENCLIFPTICHNPIDDAKSYKLYYYFDRHIFHCYTECASNYNLITLYQKISDLSFDTEISFHDSFEFIKNFFYKDLADKYVPSFQNKDYESLTSKYLLQEIPILPEYPENILSLFIDFLHPSWERDGIVKETLAKFGIKFSIYYNKIIIPHRDSNGRLIGIRVRNLEERDIAFGKYMPLSVGDISYRHLLGYNLYGLYENKEAIKKYRKAIIFEGEKSVLLSDKYYGEDSIAVAVCGSALNKIQVRMLTSLGVDEIILAFDKEFTKPFDKEYVAYENKLRTLGEKFRGLVNFSYLIDEKNLLEKKDSPIDRGLEIFEKLLNTCRVRI